MEYFESSKNERVFLDQINELMKENENEKIKVEMLHQFINRIIDSLNMKKEFMFTEKLDILNLKLKIYGVEKEIMKELLIMKKNIINNKLYFLIKFKWR